MGLSETWRRPTYPPHRGVTHLARGPSPGRVPFAAGGAQCSVQSPSMGYFAVHQNWYMPAKACG